MDEVDVEYFGKTEVILDFTVRRASENDELQAETISTEIEMLTKKGCSLFCIVWFVSNADLLLLQLFYSSTHLALVNGVDSSLHQSSFFLSTVTFYFNESSRNTLVLRTSRSDRVCWNVEWISNISVGSFKRGQSEINGSL